MSSTLVGRSGRVYQRDRVLQRHPTKPEFSVYLAHCEQQPYVLKPVSQSIFEHSRELKRDMGDKPRLRTHIDENEEEHTLVYEYFKGDLLSVVQNNPDLPLETRKLILREVGLGLRDLHYNGWLHLDTKPNNILLNWSVDNTGCFCVERVALGDLDCALKLEGTKLLNYRIGNVMWRSPEGQMGKGVGKPSEVFAFGLLCLYTITGVETLHPDFQQLKEDDTEPELVILYKLLSMFGPVSSELTKHVDDEYWNRLLTALSREVEEEDVNMRFSLWKEAEFPNLDYETKRMILRMTNLDPRKRATMIEILEDDWWD